MILLLLHLVGFHTALPTLMMHGQAQIKITKKVSHEPCTHSYIYTSSICLESCVNAEETLHRRPVQNCQITQQKTQFIGRAGVIVLFEGPRAWKQRLTKATRGNILTGNEILKALRRS